MNTETTALSVVQRAVVALGYNEENRKGLTALAGESKHITAITNADGREQAHGAMMKLKYTRVEIEKRGKSAREDATAFSKAVIAEEKALVGIITGEEERLQALRDGWDDRIKAERQALIDAEIKRMKDIEERIAALDGNKNLTPASGSQLITEHIDDLHAIDIDDSFAEFRDTAELAKSAGLARLAALRTAAVEHEAAQAKLKKDQEELARLRAEQDARDKTERERVAAETAAENARLASERTAFEAEQAAAREVTRKENARIAAEQAAAQRVIDDARKALEARQQAERDAQAEETRVANERAERAEREAEAQRVANYRPTFDEIVAFVAAQYGKSTETVRTWICEVQAERAAA